MRFQKAIKRMIALGTGAVMLSSGARFAHAAANLANFPSPSIKYRQLTWVVADAYNEQQQAEM